MLESCDEEFELRWIVYRRFEDGKVGSCVREVEDRQSGRRDGRKRREKDVHPRRGILSRIVPESDHRFSERSIVEGVRDVSEDGFESAKRREGVDVSFTSSDQTRVATK